MFADLFSFCPLANYFSFVVYRKKLLLTAGAETILLLFLSIEIALPLPDTTITKEKRPHLL